MYPMFKDGEPYTFKRKSVWWYGSIYELCFDETPVRILSMSRETVEDMVFLLNTAWNDGCRTGHMREELKKEQKS
jgi:hypothetical protein